MKKFALSLMTLALATYALSQPFFQPIEPDHRYYYQVSDSNYITNAVFIDSTAEVGGETIYHLNRIAALCDTCSIPPGQFGPVYRLNQPQVFGYTVAKQADGFFRFEGVDTFWINPLALIGDTWIFTPDGTVEASVTNIESTQVLDQVTIVKVIATSDNRLIRLSEFFGIVQYQTPTEHYELVGIDGPNFGERLPSYFDFFEFSVGDVYQYRGSYPQNPGKPTKVLYREKITILDKEVTADAITYDIHRVFRSELMGSTPPFPFSFEEESTITYAYDPNAVPDLYPGAITYQPLLIAPINPNEGDEWGLVDVYRDAENGRVTKTVGTSLFSDSDPYPLFQINNEEPDRGYACCADGFYAVYQEGLGLVKLQLFYFEVTESYELEGYVQQGDTTGTITPDSLLVVSANETLPSEEQLTLFPNPTPGMLNIDAPDNWHAFQLQLHDHSGRLIMQKQVSTVPYQVNLQELTPGVYWLEISNGKAKRRARFIRQ